MTSAQPHESIGAWREIAEWDWVWLGAGNVLHAVADVTNDADEDWYGEGKTECGQSGVMTIPGLFSRMGAIRCVRCCKATGMPQGEQSPKNVDACRPIVESRLEATRASL
jgi:hypothetical protein